MSRLVVVSNRVALPRDRSARAGGLAVGVLSALKRARGLWLGWSGETSEAPGGGQPRASPDDQFGDAARRRAKRDPDAFWAEQAKTLHWFKPWTQVLDWSNAPHAKWFVGGQINASYNCLDRHLTGSRKDKAAIVFEGEPGDCRTLTFQQLHREVCKFANVLKSLGVAKGDRVTIYLPMVPEAVIAMLACARLGAIHSVVLRREPAEHDGVERPEPGAREHREHGLRHHRHVDHDRIAAADT